MNKLITLTGMTLALSAGSLFGNTITQTTAIADNPVSFNQTVSVNDFNTALGTLNSISLALTYAGDVNISINNTGGANSYTNALASTTLSLTGPSGSIFSGIAESATSASGALVSGVNTLPSVAFSGSQLATLLDLTDFEGNGTTPVTFNFIGSAVNASGTYPGPPNSVYFGGGADASGSLAVTYNFTPASTTPEPATMSLFGSALLGLGFYARKRAKKA